MTILLYSCLYTDLREFAHILRYDLSRSDTSKASLSIARNEGLHLCSKLSPIWVPPGLLLTIPGARYALPFPSAPLTFASKAPSPSLLKASKQVDLVQYG